MARLRAALGFALLLAPHGARARAPAWNMPVAEASARFGIPAAWIGQVIAAESAGQTERNGRPLRSPKGAIGLMQLMPGTWLAMRDTLGLGSDPDDPRDNILAGTAYLRTLYDRFGYPGLFAAYNAGPGRYAEYLSRGRPLPRETIGYLARVTRAPVVLPPLDDRLNRVPHEVRQIFALAKNEANDARGPFMQARARPTVFFPLDAGLPPRPQMRPAAAEQHEGAE